MNGPPTVVVAGVIQDADRSHILISRRPDTSHLGGLWEFPGGKVEPGETLESALTREMEEEIGVRVHVGPLVLDVLHTYPERRVHLYFFECTILDGTPTAKTVSDIRWCKPRELHRYPMPDANAVVVDRLRSEDALRPSQGDA